MTWVYDRTHSLLMAIIMHVSLTASAFIFLTNISGTDIIVSTLTYAFLLYSTVFVVNFLTKGQIIKGACSYIKGSAD